MSQSFLGANSPHGSAHTQNLFLPAGPQDNATRPPKRQRTTPTQQSAQAAANSFMAASNQAGNNASAASQQQQKYTNNQQNQYRGGTSNNAGVGGQGHSQQQQQQQQQQHQQQQHQQHQQHQQQQDPSAATVPNHPTGAASKYMSPTIPHAPLQHHTSIPPPPRPLQQPSSNLTHHSTTVDPRIKSETVADVDDIIAALRVREEGSNETFAVPIGIIDGWESMMTALQKCFNRSGDIKLMNSRGDTISRFMLSHFLKDGTLLIVSFGPPTARPAPPPPKPTSPPKPPVPTTAVTTLSIPSPHHPPQQQQQQQPTYSPLPPAPAPTPPAATTTTQQPPPPPPPPYKLSRSITTVEELWQEWENGLPPNQPSVKFLEEKYGPKWRTSQAERKFFSRRKVVVDEVRKLMEQGRSAWEAVGVVESWRDARSLDALSKLIVERRKSGGVVGGGAVGGGSAKGEKKESAHMVNEWS